MKSGETRRRFRDWGLGTGDWGLGTGDWGLGTGDWGLGTGDWGLGTGDWGLGTGDWGLGTGFVISSPASLACPALTGVGILHSIRIKPIFSFQNLSVRLPVPASPRPRIPASPRLPVPASPRPRISLSPRQPNHKSLNGHDMTIPHSPFPTYAQLTQKSLSVIALVLWVWKGVFEIRL
ncbi:MAG: hypothetical protein KME21_22230 [Desmonostoc vinosum HA7617-LM4]|nr:hypothetical protein [Desmonostoc vinosum HA7617-LM4]